MRLSRPFIGLASAATTLTLAFAACNPDATAPGKQQVPALTAPEAQSIGREAAGEVQSVASSFTVGDLFGSAFDPAFAPPATSPTGLCPSISPFPPVDSDSDRVPDDVTLTFTLPDCHFARADGASLDITGTIEISDPTPTTHDFGLRVAFGNLQRQYTAPGGDSHLRRLSGVRQLLKTATEFTGVDSTDAHFESTHDGSGDFNKAWVVDFKVDDGQSFGWDRHLPSGTLTVNGTSTRTRGDVTRSLEVTTLTGLHFDATCTAEQKFDAGELQIVLTGFEHSGTIDVKFTACGVDPTITFTPATT